MCKKRALEIQFDKIRFIRICFATQLNTLNYYNMFSFCYFRFKDFFGF